MIEILLNGQPYQVPTETSIAALLERLELTTPGVAVEVNTAVVPKARHASTHLAPGDRVEVVTLVGGG